MPNILLCQLGTSPIILIEALYLLPEGFDEVHAIGTNNTRSDYRLLTDYFSKRPELIFSLTIVEEIDFVDDSGKHMLWEEYLWRWYIDKSGDTIPYVCLTGGVKTMVASLQKMTTIYGANDVFHVLIHPEPKTVEEVEAKAATIQFVSMGAEKGWASIKKMLKGGSWLHFDNIRPATYFARLEERNANVRGVVYDMLARLNSKETEATGFLPFSCLNLLSEETFRWLQEPLRWEDLTWLQKLPKAELHCHLGGFATFGEALNEVRNADTGGGFSPEDISKPVAWPFPPKTVSLPDYMHLGDNTGSTLFKNAKRLKKQIELLYKHYVLENIRYAEVRCSPNNYASGERSAWEVLEDMQGAFQEMMDVDGRCHVNLIIIATRKSEGDFSPISKHLALAITASQRILPVNKCRVVGVDLAGFENEKTRASYFTQDFTGVLRCGLAITAHAGENDSAEGIWQAVHALHARRLGHALHLYQAPDLLQTVADRRIAVEMCPYANYQIKGFAPMQEKSGALYPAYPLLNYLKKGVLVTVNTDNIGISDASLSRNLQLLVKLCPAITRLEVLQLIRNSLEAAFVSPILRNELLQDFEKEVFYVLNEQVRP